MQLIRQFDQLVKTILNVLYFHHYLLGDRLYLLYVVCYVVYNIYIYIYMYIYIYIHLWIMRLEKIIYILWFYSTRKIMLKNLQHQKNMYILKSCLINLCCYVTVKNTLSKCIDGVCFELNNLNISLKTFSGCAQLDLYDAEVNLGCFHL